MLPANVFLLLAACVVPFSSGRYIKSPTEPSCVQLQEPTSGEFVRNTLKKMLTKDLEEQIELLKNRMKSSPWYQTFDADWNVTLTFPSFASDATELKSEANILEDLRTFYKMAQQIKAFESEHDRTHLQEDFEAFIIVSRREFCNLKSTMNSRNAQKPSAKAIDQNVSMKKNDYLKVAHKCFKAFVGYLSVWKELLKVQYTSN